MCVNVKYIVKRFGEKRYINAVHLTFTIVSSVVSDDNDKEIPDILNKIEEADTRLVVHVLAPL